MSEQTLTSRVETVNFAVQALNGEVNTSPVFRLLIDVSFGSLLGAFQSGYYVRVNDSVYFVSKQTIQVATYEQTEKVFAFLAKTKLPFTISVRHSETLSRFQSVTGDVSHDSTFYSLREFKVFRGLWRTIEGELFENKYSPAMVRFSGDSLDWYVKLVPEYSLQFSQVANIPLEQVATQGHLEVFKMPQVYTLPYYIYSQRKKLTFFNHSLEGDMYVIPLGPEMRIVHLREETQISSTDHDPVVLDVGEYLLVHPRPRKDAVD
jgi:hypothetical protein